jgi:hypothetical protein
MERIAHKPLEREVDVAIHIHVNHANSVTPLVAKAVRKLLAMGFRDIRNQGVLMRGVNDSQQALLDLCFTLLNDETSSPPLARALHDFLGAPLMLWAHEDGAEFALALGRDAGDAARFCEADREMTGSALDVFANIIERKRAEERLIHDAFHDPLTGLAQVELALVADQVEGPLVGHYVSNLLILPAVGLRRRAPLVGMLFVAAGLIAQPLVGSSPVATPYLTLLFLLISLGWYASTRVGLAGVGLTLAAVIVSLWT